MRQAGIAVETYGVDLDRETQGRNDREPNSGPYRIRFRANVEADEEYKNLSANMLKERGIKGIILLECLLLGFAFYLATEAEADLNRRHLDVENFTFCFGSRVSGGGVPSVGWDRDYREVYVDWWSPGRRYSDLRCREAISSLL